MCEKRPHRAGRCVPWVHAGERAARPGLRPDALGTAIFHTGTETRDLSGLGSRPDPVFSRGRIPEREGNPAERLPLTISVCKVFS